MDSGRVAGSQGADRRDLLGALLRENRRRGVEPTYRTCSPRYKRPADIPLEVVMRAVEAAAGGRHLG